MDDQRWKTIEAWMTEHGDSIVRTVYLVTRDRAVSREIAQEVFIRAYRKLHQFQGRSNPRTWLHRIAVNLARNHLRRRRDDSLDSHSDDDTNPGAGSIVSGAWSPSLPGPEEATIRADQRSTVRSCVEALPERLRIVVVLYYLDDRPVAEVAAVLGLPAGTVKSRLAKARSMLKERLSGFDTEEHYATEQ